MFRVILQVGENGSIVVLGTTYTEEEARYIADIAIESWNCAADKVSIEDETCGCTL